MTRGSNPFARFTRAHICADPLIQFDPPKGLAYHAIGLLTTKTTTSSGVMRLIEDAILEVLIIRKYNVWWISNLYNSTTALDRWNINVGSHASVQTT